MLLNRDYVGHMASQLVKKLVEDEQIAIKEKDVEPVILKVRTRMMEEITIEDKINEEVRTILTQHIVQTMTNILREEEKIEVEVRKKIASQKKEILEGSEEWDLLFRKYYSDELRRAGIAAAPEEHQK